MRRWGMGRFVSKIVCRGKNKDGFWINEFFGTLALNIIPESVKLVVL